MKKALFRLDSGGMFGLGHLMRSKALADALYKLDIECTFSVKNIHSKNAVVPHQLFFLDTEEEFLSSAASYDIVIIDHYDYTSEQFFKLSQLEQSILVVLDDECKRGYLYADIVINPVSQTNSLNYSEVTEHAQLLLGPEYILLREAFQQVQYLPYEKRQSIIITFGGSDVTHLTLPVLQKITQTTLNSEHIIVVTGSACENLHAIADYCKNNNFEHQHDVADMAALFSKVKLAISAAGSTAFELASCGVPSVFALVADNQLLSITEQVKQGWCTMADCRKQNKVDKLISSAEKILQSGKLEQYSQLAHTVVDGKGAGRAALKILEACNMGFKSR